ncbi:Hypothetical protein Tpal_249 [Trichococcus palustris]|jgi:uncharacterized protein YvpB|uniref:Peptidase C39-like domain-containing protein n=1 Tax=Trichococcus palustris TaxID=140314 RepID=A0A143Y7S7_9LACT|nr:C39 family peptidase [Trichococcus palustris]CZQ81846.1 Hypothetical protein Tpal_249 [Trichococcus palustris]SFK61593.1 Uncharacterized protein YvpB [Trichococcus palustris]
MRKKSSFKKMLSLFTFVCLLTVSVLYLKSMAMQRSTERHATVSNPPTQMAMATEQNEWAESVLLDVPLLNQMDPPALLLGCEVTSLAMVLQYNGIAVSKNELADRLPSVPIYYDNGLQGNPNEGFVGDVTGYAYGFCVYHGPIASLAAQYVAPDRVKDITGSGFDAVISALNQGCPVWVVTTTTFLPVDDMEIWQTPTGPVGITYFMHSVVIVGYDADSIYLNDSYGIKDQVVDRAGFIQSWEQLGNQAIYID